MKIIVENCVSCWLLFIWNAHSLAHLLSEIFLFCSSTSTSTHAHYDPSKRSRVSTVLLKQTNIWLCTIKNKQLIALLSVFSFSLIFVFVSFIVLLFVSSTFVSSAMWWMERVKRPVLCTFTVHPSVPCCFCFRCCCFCSCSKLFGRFKCVRRAHTHTHIYHITHSVMCVFILKSAHEHCNSGSRRQTPEETLFDVFHWRWASHPFFGAVV